MLDKKKVKLGIAPIGWTNDDMPDLGKENTFQQCVSEMALAGFTGSEVGGKYPTDVETLKKALDLRGIQICNCWFSSFLISRPYEETEKEFIKQTDFLKAMGAKVIGVSEQSYSIQGKDQPIFEGKYVMNDEEWKLLTDGLNKLGQIAKDKGMMLTFHHHMGTVIQTEEEIDRLKKVWISSEVIMIDNINMSLENIVDDIIEFGDIIPNKVEIFRSLNKKDYDKILSSIDFSNSSTVIIRPKEKE